MNLEHANFWVRPFQFRGDGSSGAAHAFARIETGGEMREFWLKVVENRLFFRETHRGQNWTFGCLERVGFVDESELVRALQLALEGGRFGRLIWPGINASLFDAGSGSYNEGLFVCLATEAAQLHILAPGVGELAVGSTQWEGSRRNHFLDWRPEGVATLCKSYRYSRLLSNAGAELWKRYDPLLAHIPREPLLGPVPSRWIRGENPQLQMLIRALCVSMWHRIALTDLRALRISLSSSYALRPMQLTIGCWNGHWNVLSSAPHDNGFPAILRQRSRFVAQKFEFIGQQTNRHNELYVSPYKSQWQIDEPPTAHEQIEAQLLLREWISQKLPPEHVEGWLNFT